jgi:hypothetical protein
MPCMALSKAKGTRAQCHNARDLLWIFLPLDIAAVKVLLRAVEQI